MCRLDIDTFYKNSTCHASKNASTKYILYGSRNDRDPCRLPVPPVIKEQEQEHQQPTDQGSQNKGQLNPRLDRHPPVAEAQLLILASMLPVHCNISHR